MLEQEKKVWPLVFRIQLLKRIKTFFMFPVHPDYLYIENQFVIMASLYHICQYVTTILFIKGIIVTQATPPPPNGGDRV